LRPDKEHPLSAGFACQKGIAFTEVQNDPDRVTTPLRRRRARPTPEGQGRAVGPRPEGRGRPGESARVMLQR
jgi:anaerobic selenocysteine-containing dehydrogenase